MPNTVLDCAAHTWPMIAGEVVIFGVLALAVAALIKYLFFSDNRGDAAA